MINTTFSQLRKILADQYLETTYRSERSIEGVSTDSRKVQKGNLFVAISGENVHGHQYISQALQKGAAAALTEKSVSSHPDHPLIRVKDSVAALQRLAAHWRQEAAPRMVIGLTGSNGKTSTKEFLGTLLSTKWRVHQTQGNFNNHIGVPLTLLALPRDVDVAVVEMGMNHLGEIDTLARIARPHWGVITNTGTAHIGEVGGFEKIIDAKLELASHLSEGRLFAGVTHVSFARRLTELHGIRLESVVEKHIANELGKQKLNSLVFHAHQRDLNHLDVRWSAEKKAHTAALPVFGNHFASNFLVAARVARAMGLSWDAIKRTGATLHLPGMRCETLSTPTGTTFLLDCYNANYDSTLGLINTLMAFRIPRVKRKKRLCLVLGDMRELGEYSLSFHLGLAPAVAKLKPDLLVTVGDLMQNLAEAVAGLSPQTRVLHCPSVTDIKQVLTEIYEDFALVALKASRGTALERGLPESVHRLFAANSVASDHAFSP